MMFTASYSSYTMNHPTSAACAEAGFSCAKTASNFMTTLLDAIFVASIIIILTSLVSVLVLGLSLITLISLLAVIILLVLVLLDYPKAPERRTTA